MLQTALAGAGALLLLLALALAGTALLAVIFAPFDEHDDHYEDDHEDWR